MTSITLEIMKELLAAWKDGGKKVRTTIVVACASIAIGALVAFLSNILLYYTPISKVGESIGAAFVVSGIAIAFLVVVAQKSKDEVVRESRIAEVEKRVLADPRETQAAWELAQIKLESYLNRNLSQVRSIFWLTLLVMIGGFTLISIGVYEAFRDSTNFNASLLASGSGVLVSFIGGTFLVLYKATMAQAKDYVTMLERINAVGMSVKILESIKDETGALKDNTTAEIAKQLLSMYSSQISHNAKHAADVKKPRR